jgi:DNA-binding MarR family transcriptional regulator
MSDSTPDISLLFDLFVTTNRVRRLIEGALASAPLRGEEYAVYSLLFDEKPMTATDMSRALAMPLTTVLDHLSSMDERGHLRRERHPRDGRAQQLSLTMAGTTVHRRTNKAWERMRRELEGSLPVPANDVRRSLRALGDAAQAVTNARADRLAG